uniref:ethylene-responsive transcription factor ERF017-like n=1 Tax=Erigeron canadensis TaxID=72917 RepID=UPI001CB9C8E1|nr:ethylene-responsive transcription factor ERF017-like [Erigeron canadensis]
MGEEGRDINNMIHNNNVDVDEAKYRGVRKRKWGKWVSEIRLPNSRERIWLGSYDSPEKAARAFDAALFCLRGHNANFNFPHQPPNIPGGTDLHPSEIQAVAAHYANSTTSHHHQLHNVSVSDDHDYIISTSSSSSSSMDVVSSSLMADHNIPDYGIFPGFDDYFIPLQPSYTAAYDYGTTTEEVIYDGSGVYSQDPCHLWNF